MKNTDLVSTACVYLHNFLRMSATSRSLYSPQGSFDLDTKDGAIIGGAWRDMISADTNMVDLQRISRRPTSDAKERNLRNILFQSLEEFLGKIYMHSLRMNNEMCSYFRT